MNFSIFRSGKKAAESSIASDDSDDNNDTMDELKEQLRTLQSEISTLRTHQNVGTSSRDQNNAQTQVYQVTEMVKMQAFYENDPELWFTIIESQFAARKITSEKTKYMQVVANLNCTTAALVKDVIKIQFVDGHYEKLKSALVAIYAESSVEKFQKLISKTEIGDMKPSQFLHHMKSLSDNTITDEFIKQLWIQRLPASSRAVLSASNDTLDNLAKMADKMWEVSDRFCVASVENGKKSSMEKVIDALEKLTNRIGALERGEHKSRRDVTPSRNRSKSRQRSKSEQKSEHENCWFHYKYGDKAQKCREPCNFSKQKN